MPTTDDVLTKARELGDLIAEHDASKKLQAVIDRLQSDPEAQRTLTDYNRQAETMAQKEQSGEPIEVDEKRKLEDLRKALIKNEVLRDYQMAQMNFVDLMRRVDQTLQEKSPTDQPDTS